ncbi:MAG: cell division protein SepF [Acidimicrobiia bacterium]|nr:cell division protein SepF [Acidimicrobiia bacterium]
MWQKTLLYLGLVDEDGIDEGQTEPGAPVTQPRPTAPPITRPQSTPVTASPPQPLHVGDQRTGRRVEPPPPTRRRMTSPEPHHTVRTDAGVRVRPGDYTGPTASHAEIIAAHSFGDAKRLADLVRERVPVIVNLRDTDPDMVRRLVDFSSGLIYALDGTMRKVAEGVILVSPPRVTLSADEERRLVDLGLFDES